MSVDLINGTQLSADLEDIADEIRSKTGSSAPISLIALYSKLLSK